MANPSAQSYKKVPWWWNIVILVTFTALSIVLVEVYNTELPVYGVFLALLIPAIYMVPCGLVQGITNVDTNQLVSLVICTPLGLHLLTALLECAF